jgi:hypothetical protein
MSNSLPLLLPTCQLSDPPESPNKPFSLLLLLDCQLSPGLIEIQHGHYISSTGCWGSERSRACWRLRGKLAIGCTAKQVGSVAFLLQPTVLYIFGEPDED